MADAGNRDLLKCHLERNLSILIAIGVNHIALQVDDTETAHGTPKTTSINWAQHPPTCAIRMAGVHNWSPQSERHPARVATEEAAMIPRLQGVDHIHVFVPDRTQAEKWYREVLGFERVAALENWAVGEGPLTIQDANRSTHLAMFERELSHNHATIAFKVDGKELLSWQQHLSDALDTKIDLVDHNLSWSIYFSDPYGNPFEITSYDYEWISEQRGVQPGTTL